MEEEKQDRTKLARCFARVKRPKYSFDSNSDIASGNIRCMPSASKVQMCMHNIENRERLRLVHYINYYRNVNIERVACLVLRGDRMPGREEQGRVIFLLQLLQPWVVPAEKLLHSVWGSGFLSL